jgi:cell division protein ZapD
MPAQDIIYQQSPQYLAKVCLYLENLFAFTQEAVANTHPIMHYDALKNIIKILRLIEKPELKSRFAKEFIRLEHILVKTLKLQSTDIWEKFIHLSNHLQNHANRFTCNLNNEPLLQSLKLRHGNQDQNFELPSSQIYYWLHQAPKIRQNMIKQWLVELQEVQTCLQVYLSILRRHTEFQAIDIQDNFLYQAFGQTPLAQLIMLKVPDELLVVPKIQVSSQAVSIHFNDPYNSEISSQYSRFRIELAIVKL